jgi:hypothetical protein
MKKFKRQRSRDTLPLILIVKLTINCQHLTRAVLHHPAPSWGGRGGGRVSTEFRRHGIPRNFLTSEVISAQFRRNSAKFRGIPRNFAGIEPEITSVFRGMPKCHFRGHPRGGVV